MQVRRGHRLAGKVVSHDDPAKALLKVLHIRRQTENRHDLGGHGDHKMVLAHHSVRLCAKADDHVAQRPVVHVLAALPLHLPGIDAQGVALLDVVVQQRRQQVVSGGDGVEIAGKVQI